MVPFRGHLLPSQRALLAVTAMGLVMFSDIAQAFELPSFVSKYVDSKRLHELAGADKGYEFTVMNQKMHFKPDEWRMEAVLLGASLLYLFLHFTGKARNRSLVTTWVRTAMPLLEDEFAAVAKRDDGSGEGKLIWNGGSQALLYASGRRGIEGLHVLFELKPFHDPLELLYNFVWDIATASPVASSRDVITLTFMLPYLNPDNVGGVFALVDKSVLRATRKGRFDLTFAKVIDAENAAEQRSLDNRFAIMSENGELTDALLGDIGDRGANQRHKVGLQAALNGDGGHLLESLVLSDQPKARPEVGPVPVAERARTLTLTLRVPRSHAQAKDSLALVESACNLVDALELGHAKLSASTVSKLRATRAQVDKDIEEEVSKYDREEQEEARQAAKKKAEQEKFDKLSPAEQEKRKQVEKKRQMRKAQGKQVKAR